MSAAAQWRGCVWEILSWLAEYGTQKYDSQPGYLKTLNAKVKKLKREKKWVTGLYQAKSILSWRAFASIVYYFVVLYYLFIAGNSKNLGPQKACLAYK